MRRCLTSVLAIALLGTGCLLTTSLDGLTDPPVTTSGDRDASLMDSSSSPDGAPQGGDGSAGVDAGNDADGAAPVDFRCSSLSPLPVFCTDFDTGTLGSIIGTPKTALGGNVQLDSLVYRSASRSLALTAPAIASGTGRASVARSFGFVPQTSIVVAFDIRIDSIDASSVNGLNISMGGYELGLFLGGSAKLREGLPVDGGGMPAYGTTNLAPPPLGRWAHLTLSVTLGTGAAPTSSATIAYDGVPQGAVPLVIHAYRSSSWSVDVGLLFIAGPDDGRDIHIDNLVIDAK
jgi:hypothetical protein